MTLRIIPILCFFTLEASAKYHNSTQLTFWNSLNWKIKGERQTQDIVEIQGIIEESIPEDLHLKIPGATCNKAETSWIGETGLPGFVMQCKCNLSYSTFVPETMSCIANSDLKQACQFTTGSWRWSTSWKWDTTDDTLIEMDSKEDYGITTAFNASTREYQTCSVESLSYWAEDMKWMEATDLFFMNDSAKPTTFKLNKMWHFSWNINDLQKSVKENLNGKILKFEIECEKPGPPHNEDEELEITSCLLVKVRGDFTIMSEYWETTVNTTVNTGARTTPKSVDLKALLIALLIPTCLILLIVAVVITVCYMKRTACFSESHNLPHETSFDDDVTSTRLIRNSANESIV